MKTIAFFGHRYISNTQAVKERLINVLRQNILYKQTKVLIGCHGEFDALSLETCLNYRKSENCEFEIDVVLTSISFLNKGKCERSNADLYHAIGCSTLVYDIEEKHFKSRITYSNKKMVEESDLIVCYVDERRGKSGAKTAIKYALKIGKKIINLFEEKSDGK